MVTYQRDGRSPLPKSEAISRVMSANKGKDTGPELKLRKALRSIGLNGYRLNWKGAPGRPDITFPRYKVAIFVHGDFWHRCPVCNLPLPKTNTDFWQTKLERNVQRDSKKVTELENSGWRVLVCWEHEIKDDVMKCAYRIKESIEELKDNNTAI